MVWLRVTHANWILVLDVHWVARYKERLALNWVQHTRVDTHHNVLGDDSPCFTCG